MNSQTRSQEQTEIVDYDSGGYDYLGFWRDKDYEHWAETAALRRMIPRLGRPQWFVDFGGGFGRNAEHYLQRARHSVLVDYSRTNLTRAAQANRESIDQGRLFLVRADLNHLPFVDRAFDAAMVVRVLHHLPDLAQTLAEMGRTVDAKWLLDIPIKHHVFGVARATLRGHLNEVRGAQPRITGDSRYPFYNFKLSTVRKQLVAQGWTTEVAASVNNFRRWDRRLPHQAVQTLSPVVRALELGLQRAGRGWWGPSQVVLATRRPGATTSRPTSDDFSDRLRCPNCSASLRWSDKTAECTGCSRSYQQVDGYWDFAGS